jgi:hypothetical protein
MPVGKLYPTNLDARDVTELYEWQLILRYNEPAELGMRESTRIALLCYVGARIGSIEARLAGRIDNAEWAEARCEYDYKKLPKKWRW